MLDKAIELAIKAHKGKKDLGGNYYGKENRGYGTYHLW